MTEVWGAEGSSAVAQPASVAEPATAGTLLRRAREASGLHVAALAVALKVPVRKLEALENDRYELLPDAVFVRALASSVCRTLKIDPQPVLDRLPHTTAPRLIHDHDLNAPFRGPLDGAGPGWLEQVSKPVVLSVFGLLLGALVLILLPRVQQEEGSAATAGTAESKLPPAETAALPAGDRIDTSAPVAATAPPPTAVMPASLPAAGPAAPVNAPAPSGAAEAPAAESATVPAPSGAILVFRARATSWVEVTDAKGVVALRKLLAAGESGTAAGVPPLHVTVGRVDATELQVRGKPFDLRPVSKDNVARFEVK